MIEAFFAAIAFGTVWGWVILVTSFIIITSLVENEHSFWAPITLVLTTLLLYKAHMGAGLHFVLDHPGKLMLLVVGYFIVGTVWGFTKWFLFAARQLEKYNEAKAEFLEKKGVKELTPLLAKEFRDRYFYSETLSRSHSGFVFNPKVREYKKEILMWMTYWPFSAVWTIINDPVRRLFRLIYQSIQGFLQGVSDRLFKGAHADMELAMQEDESRPVLPSTRSPRRGRDDTSNSHR